VAHCSLWPLPPSYFGSLSWHVASCDLWHHLRLCELVRSIIWLYHRHISVPCVATFHRVTFAIILLRLSWVGTFQRLTFTTVTFQLPDLALPIVWPLPSSYFDSLSWHLPSWDIWHHLIQPLQMAHSSATFFNALWWFHSPVSWLSNNRGSKSSAKRHLFSVTLCWGTGQRSFVLWNNDWQFVLLHWPLILYQLYVSFSTWLPFICCNVFVCCYLIIR
jgi:hypothetical protein